MEVASYVYIVNIWKNYNLHCQNQLSEFKVILQKLVAGPLKTIDVNKVHWNTVAITGSGVCGSWLAFYFCITMVKRM